ncbi:MAG: cytochrome c biogenesis protein CcsA [Muribaculaceae bacterium]|nr:cytochrome c biogenesis protein CcsA [Muribaculaceae bacterium]
MMARISFILLGLISLALIAATVIEKCVGSEAPIQGVYTAPWLVALWALCAVTAITAICRRRLRIPVILLHAALVLILVGAGVTHFIGIQSTIILHEGQPACDTFDNNDNHRLPFSIELLTCGTRYIPATSAPADFYSVLRLSWPDGRSCEAEVSVEHFLDVDNYRFCQNSIAEATSTLTVNYDPWGIGLSYTGYFVLFAAMVAMLTDPKGQFRRLYRSAAVTIFTLIATSTWAAGSDTPRVLQAPLARSFGELYIYDGDRIRPMSVYARDWLVKVHGSATYHGFTPEQVLTGFIFYYDDWAAEPLIKLGSKSARKAAGTKNKLAALKDFGSASGYVLGPLMKHADTRLRSDNEKVALLTRTVTGKALAILPVVMPDSTGISWLSISDVYCPQLEEAARFISHGQYRAAATSFRALREWQDSVLGAAAPSATQLKAETLYIKIFRPFPAALLMIAAAVIILCIWHSRQLHQRWYAIVLTATGIVWLWLCVVLGLRWYIGGHIPLTSGPDTMLVLAWICGILTLITLLRGAAIAPAAMIATGVAMAVAALGVREPAIGQLVPALTSPLLSIHVMLVMCAYALLLMCAINSIRLLCSPTIPETARCLADISLLILYPAEMLLGAGIFVGAIWANQAWGRYWGWDPKETWALVTFFVYCLPLHPHVIPSLSHPRVLSWFLTLAFLTVLMTWFGVNYLLTGLHSYA